MNNTSTNSAGMTIAFDTIGGVRIRYAIGPTQAGPTILLTSPWPESILAFAPIWSTLARSARLFAVDLPGFGGSERRDDLLSPRAMAAFLVELIEELGLDKPHLIGPDIGTSAALFVAGARPDLVSSVIVGSGAAAVPIQLGGALEQWVLARDLDEFRAKDPRVIVGAALDTISGFALPVEVRNDYLDSYDGERFIESMRYVRSYPHQLADLAQLLPFIETPALIIAGEHDRAVPLANAEFLHRRLPHSRLAIVDAGHFVWEEAATEYAGLVTEWVASGHRNATAPIERAREVRLASA